MVKTEKKVAKIEEYQLNNQLVIKENVEEYLSVFRNI